MAVDYIGVQQVDHHLNNNMIIMSSQDYNVSTGYKRILFTTTKRTGHARFRRAPSSQFEDNKVPVSSNEQKEFFLNKSVDTSSMSTSSSSLSSGGGELEGSVSNGKRLGVVAPAPAFSSRKPPLPATHRKRCVADRPVVANVHGSGSGCCKRRKTGSKREIRRVPIIGSKVTSIPADDYSWKKYGEKRIEGSPYPRVYYKCSTEKGCPATKRVELATDNSKMLLVTYDGEHRHRLVPKPVPTGLTGLAV
ncbi:hypothetical protein M8C21_029102 [Ambrosia artemisiifolia]|uniref:WRKY domain-containing protein n=1 Tax=Ambrosia artemisiifolia TaxID=4212 RepID=A0AAD5GSZ0_AMBAR|nr:hypothetical protein M8C21_029102 [Ambrosia artemisiifolia]